jgi:hypothetical protein
VNDDRHTSNFISGRSFLLYYRKTGPRNNERYNESVLYEAALNGVRTPAPFTFTCKVKICGWLIIVTNYTLIDTFSWSRRGEIRTRHTKCQNLVNSLVCKKKKVPLQKACSDFFSKPGNYKTIEHPVTPKPSSRVTSGHALLCVMNNVNPTSSIRHYR